MSMQEKVLDRLVVVTKRLADAEGLNKSYQMVERQQAETVRGLMAENKRLTVTVDDTQARLDIHVSAAKAAGPRLTALHRAAAALANEVKRNVNRTEREDPPVFRRDVYRQRGAEIMNREELLKNLDVALSESYGDCEVSF